MANNSFPRLRSPPDWENPAIYGINKRASHVTLRSYTNPKQAFEHYKLLSETSTSSRRLSLNGNNWDFELFDKPSDTPDGFYKPEFDVSKWNKVGVKRRENYLQSPCFFPQSCLSKNTLPLELFPGYCSNEFGTARLRHPTISQLYLPFPCEPPFCPFQKPNGVLPPCLHHQCRYFSFPPRLLSL